MAAINGKNGMVDRAAKKARPTLQSLTNKDAPDSYALLGDNDDELPTSPDGVVNDMFRKNSKIEREAAQAKPPAAPATSSTPTSSTPTTSPPVPDRSLKPKPSDPKADSTKSPKTPAPVKPLKIPKPTDASQGLSTPAPQTNPANVQAETPKNAKIATKLPTPPAKTPAPVKPLNITKPTDASQGPPTPAPQSSPSNVPGKTPKEVKIVSIEPKTPAPSTNKPPISTPKVVPTPMPAADSSRRKPVADPPKKPAPPAERRQTLAAPAAPESKALPGTSATSTVKPLPQRSGVIPISTPDKPTATVPTTTSKPRAASPNKAVTITTLSSPTPITTPTSLPPAPPVTPAVVAAGTSSAPTPPQQPKSEEDMPKKVSPPMPLVPKVIENTEAKPKAGILKRTQADSDTKKEVQIQEPAPITKRKSVNLDPFPLGESLPTDPNRSEKINKRRPTQFLPKGEKMKVQLPPDDEHLADEADLNEKSDTNQRVSRHVAFNVTDDEDQADTTDLKLKKRRPTTFVPMTRSVAVDVDDDIGHADDLLDRMYDEDEGERTRLLEDDQPQRVEQPKEKEERPKWDVFESSPLPENDAGIEFLYDVVRKIFKVVTIFFCFLIVWGGAAIHKATVLFAASQVDNHYSYTCQQYNTTEVNATKSSDFYKCFREGFPNEYGDSVPSCIKTDFTRIGNVTTQQRMCVDIQARWIWSLVLIIGTPEVFVFIRCLWNISFKKRRNPNMDALFMVLLTETLSLLGTCCFVFVVLPSMKSSIHGLALMAAVGFLPSLLNALNRPEDESRRCAQRIFDILALLCQLSGLVFWPVMIGLQLMPDFDQSLIWSVPLSLFLMSLTWWVNYIDGASRLCMWTDPLVRLKRRIRKARTKIYLLVSLWKMIIVVCGMFIFVCVYQKIPFEDLFNLNRNKCGGMLTAQDVPGQKTDWVFLWLVNVLTAITSYFCARAAAKVWIQFQAYAMPLILVTPILAAVLLLGCHAWVFDNCYFYGMVPSHLAFDCRLNTELLDILRKDYIWLLYVWWLAQLWVTKHIWFQDNDKLAKTSILFFNPLYGGVVHEQWLLYNRCPKDKNVTSGKTIHEIDAMSQKAKTEEEKKAKTEEEKRAERKRKDNFGDVEEGFGDAERKKIEEQRNEDKIPIIYICATMWHESKTEMNNMLKSIFRLDMDQCTRRKTQQFLGMKDRDFYNFEAHIFFDDCMNRGHPRTMFDYVVNDFVAQLVETVDGAASIIYQTNISVPSPEKYPTPYGGRLVWTMPGGNQIICHLKDKEKIRIKKRWSQVMYMYYFLGYKLFSQDLPTNRKQIKADNTFLLALDGDVDFEPGALRLLVDIMKKDIKVGAACGRIHPTGSGPMVWYQKFEYAMGHWMQKATEHVLGCVLCSPGCFSLFRGSAIMDDNVMQRYTTTSEEARHLVQYDQGEDRWLCTLLLQRGHRVEYSAASDSFTFAPEEFNEFYNQRRRWTPSTMANVMDLLGSWRNTVRVNENISMLYIAYQGSLLISSLLGTGTIFLMIVGALSVAIKIDNTLSFILNAIPLIIFIILCLTMKSDVQLIAANVLTVAYGLIQILVLIAIIIQMTVEGVGSPTFIFFAYVAGTFIFAAILHPQEFLCVTHGLLYFILVPSMYMLLMIYSLTNLNNVSWGTREVKQTKSQKEQEEFEKEEAERKAREEEAKKNGTFERLKNFIKSKSDITTQKEDGWTLGIGNCFRFICCPRPVQEDKTHLNRIFDKMDDQKKAMDEQTALIRKQKKSMKRLAQHIEVLNQNQEELMDLMDDSDEEEAVQEAAGLAAKNKAMSMKRKMSRSARRMSVMPPAGLSVETDDEDEKDEEEEKRKAEEKKKREEAEELEKIRKDEEHKKMMLEKELRDPIWIKDTERLREGPIVFLPEEEELFFKGLIKRYLAPLVKNKLKEEQVNMELAALKNKISFGYILLNAAFVAVIFTLQANKEKLSITWPWGNNLKLEPIGLMFLLFFVVIMLLQTIGMVTHRMGTFLHIVANTQLMTTITDNQSMVSNMINMAKTAKKVSNDDNISVVSETESEYGGSEEVRPSRRKSTIYRLEKGFAKHNDNLQRRPTIVLEDNLEVFLNKMVDDVHDDRATPEKLTEKYKRNSIFQRRKSNATFQFLKERRNTLHRITPSGYNGEDDRGSMDGYPNTAGPNDAFLGGYGRIKKGNHGLPNGGPYWQDTDDSEEPNRQLQQQSARQIPLDDRKVSRYSMSPTPDYDLIDEANSGSLRQKQSNASSGSFPIVPQEDYDIDDNDSHYLLPAITVSPNGQRKPDLELKTVIRPIMAQTSQVDDPPADYDMSDPTRSQSVVSIL